jgi:hypothetical protein
MEYTSKGVGNAALTTGIIGTAGAALNMISNAGGLGSLLGGRRMSPADHDPGNQFVTRHELDLIREINSRDMQIASLQANSYTDKSAQVLQAQIGQQAVWNATQQSTMQCLQSQIAQLQNMTKLGVPGNNIIPPYPAPPFMDPLTYANMVAATKTNTTATTTNP